MEKIWRGLFIGTLVLLVTVGSSLGYFWQKTSTDLTTTQDDLVLVQDVLVLTQDDLALAQEQLALIQNDLVDTQNQLEVTKGKLKSTEDELDIKSQELVSILKVYPLKYFPDEATLKLWRSTQPIADWASQYEYMRVYRVALDMQAAAMEEGYMIFPELGVVDGEFAIYIQVILANGNLYFIYPHIADVTGIDLNVFRD